MGIGFPMVGSSGSTIPGSCEPGTRKPLVKLDENNTDHKSKTGGEGVSWPGQRLLLPLPVQETCLPRTSQPSAASLVPAISGEQHGWGGVGLPRQTTWGLCLQPKACKFGHASWPLPAQNPSLYKEANKVQASKSLWGLSKIIKAFSLMPTT